MGIDSKRSKENRKDLRSPGLKKKQLTNVYSDPNLSCEMRPERKSLRHTQLPS